MLRTLFVLTLAAVGVAYAFQGAFYGLLLYLWVAYFRPEQWVWSDAVSNLYLSYVAGVVTIAGAFLARAHWRVNARVILLGVFLAHSGLSLLLADNFDYAWPFWVEFFKTALISYLIVVLVTDAKQFRLVLVVIALSLGFEAGKQGLLELFRHPGASSTNTHPMLGDNNGVAVGLLMLVPFLTTLAATATSRWERVFHRVMAFAVLYRAVITYSRGGFLACGALGFMYVLRSPKRLVAATGIAIATLIIVPALPQEFWERMGTIKSPSQMTATEDLTSDDVSTLGRLHFWHVAVTMADAQPFFGVGHNSFNVAYDKFDDLQGTFGRSRSVHSAWFGVLAELGYPGLLLFLTQLVLAFGACWRARRAAAVNEEAADLKAYSFALEACLVVFLVGGTFLPAQYSENLWHTIGLSIALDVMARAALASKAARVSPMLAFDPAAVRTALAS